MGVLTLCKRGMDFLTFDTIALVFTFCVTGFHFHLHLERSTEPGPVSEKLFWQWPGYISVCVSFISCCWDKMLRWTLLKANEFTGLHCRLQCITVGQSGQREFDVAGRSHP